MAADLGAFRAIQALQLDALTLCNLRKYDLGEHQFASRSQYQAPEIQFILRQLVEKSIEHETPFCMLDGDIYKAYDSVEHATWVKGLTKGGWKSLTQRRGCEKCAEHNR